MGFKKKVIDKKEEVVETIDSKVSEEKDVASTEVMEKALELVADKFNLGGDYVMISFADAGVKCSVTMRNMDFEVTVKIRDTEKLGLINLKELK